MTERISSLRADSFPSLRKFFSRHVHPEQVTQTSEFILINKEGVLQPILRDSAVCLSENDNSKIMFIPGVGSVSSIRIMRSDGSFTLSEWDVSKNIHPEASQRGIKDRRYSGLLTEDGLHISGTVKFNEDLTALHSDLGIIRHQSLKK